MTTLWERAVDGGCTLSVMGSDAAWSPAELPGLVAWWAGAVRTGDAPFAVMIDERTVGDEPVERVVARGRLD